MNSVNALKALCQFSGCCERAAEYLMPMELEEMAMEEQQRQQAAQ
jgi:hypothetical protein